ncbi:uncharacterized protein [Palaemon carinicauda]|uniref:uncharacterized protein n=1 Tax=Palaemon carinicauda TaxID=392227 RepID=UPI0035B67D8B
MKSLLLFGLLGFVLVSAQGPRRKPCNETDFTCKCELLMGIKPPKPPGGDRPHIGERPRGGERPHGGDRPRGGERPPHDECGLKDTIKTECLGDTEPGQDLTVTQKDCVFTKIATCREVIVDGTINETNAIQFMTSNVEKNAELLGLDAAAVDTLTSDLTTAVTTCIASFSTADQIGEFRVCMKDSCEASLGA